MNTVPTAPNELFSRFVELASSNGRKLRTFLAESQELLSRSTIKERNRERPKISLLQLLVEKSYLEDFHSTVIYYLLTYKEGDTKPYQIAFIDFLFAFYRIPRIDTYGLTVEKEVKSDGRIDFFISNNKKEAIIVENKIRAKDQNRQIPRYYWSTEKKGYTVLANLYLTPNGHIPDKSGWNPDDKTIKIHSIPYYHAQLPNLVVGWIEKCTDVNPAIRNLVDEYITIVKEIVKVEAMKSVYAEFVKYLISNENAQEAFVAVSKDLNYITAVIKDEMSRHFVDAINADEMLRMKHPNSRQDDSANYLITFKVDGHLECGLYFEESFGYGLYSDGKKIPKEKLAPGKKHVEGPIQANSYWPVYHDLAPIAADSLESYQYFRSTEQTQLVIEKIKAIIKAYDGVTFESR